MSKRCYMCGIDTIFYVWSTSRNFPREKLIEAKKLKTKAQKASISEDGQVVCFKCLKELRES